MDAALILHGLGSSSEGRKVNLIKKKLNMESFTPDFPQHGKNEKEFCISLIIKEMDNIILKMKDFDKRYLIGRSFGGYISLLILKRYPHFFRKICLLSPAINMEDAMQNMINEGYIANDFKLGEKQLVPPDYFKFYDKQILGINSHLPVLILQGNQDNITKPAFLNDFLREKPNFKLKTFDVNHDYGENEEKILNLAKDFILKDSIGL